MTFCASRKEHRLPRRAEDFVNIIPPSLTYSESDTQDKGWYHGKPGKKEPLAAGAAPGHRAGSGSGGNVGGGDDR